MFCFTVVLSAANVLATLSLTLATGSFCREESMGINLVLTVSTETESAKATIPKRIVNLLR